MPVEFIRLSSHLPASAERVYAAWLDALEHSRMTGGKATVEPRVGGRHTAWDGYIEGEILELEPGLRIVQSWRSTEFPPGHPDSRLEIRLMETPGGCEVMLAHSEIPEGQGEQYETGWQEHYFNPMTRYFRAAPTEVPSAMEAAPKARKVAAPKKTKAAAKRAKVAKKAKKPVAKAKRRATKAPTTRRAVSAKRKTKAPAKRAPARKAKKATKKARAAK
jgi:uncharacterized protein YndB with AHSA1/START domain